MKYTYFSIFILFTTVYFLTSSEGYFFHADASYLRFEVAESIVNRLDLSIPEGLGVKGIDGRDYSWIGLGSALLAVPLLITGKFLGISPEITVSFVNILFAALTTVLLFIFTNALGYSQKASLIVTMFYGLGTLAWPMSKQPFDHPIETFFILLSFYHCYLSVNNKRARNIIFSGAAAGMAFLTRPTTVLALPALATMVLHSQYRNSNPKNTGFHLVKSVSQFTTAFLPFAGISLWYNDYRFGSVFETGYSLIASRLGMDFFSGTSLLTGLSGFLISPGKGFFFFSPIAVLFFFSIKSFYKRHTSVAAAFILLISSYLLFLSKNVYWHGDWTWGPRYLLAVTPFLIIPLAEIVDSPIWREKVLKHFIYFLFSISFVIQVAAVTVDCTKYFNNLKYIENVTFIHSTAEGVQPISEPPTEIYFNWSKSPIIAQFKYIIEIGKKLHQYQNKMVKKSSPVFDKFEASPRMNLYDFWWVYIFFINGNHSVLLLTFAMLSLSLYSAWKLFHEVK